MLSQDYPRMMFHRTEPPVTVLNEEQEQALGPEWSRRIWPTEPEPEPVPPSQGQAKSRKR